MIKLSRLADYAIVIMGHFATSDVFLLSAQQLAENTGISHATVSKVLKKLLQAKLLVSTQGTKGGYGLARPPEAITVAEMVEAVDGPVFLTECTNHSYGQCHYTKNCIVKHGLHSINNTIQQTLRSMSLAELIAPIPHTINIEEKNRYE